MIGKWRRCVPFVVKGVMRNRVRTFLTIASVAVAMFLFTVVEAMQRGVQRATEVTANDTTLVVYRKDRYCPFTSRLPQSYQSRIEGLEHVETAVPVRVVVSNCRTSLNIVTFRGVPEAEFASRWAPEFDIVEGSVDEWRRRGDAALVGESLAHRRGLSVGDRLTAAGISVYVAGVLRSDDPQHRNAAYTHLPFIQEASERGGTGGVVTQFNVTVDDSANLDTVAAAIDSEFLSAQEPTATSPEKAFVARAARDLLGLVEFSGLLGYGALLAVLALLGNAIVLAVQERVRDHAVMQTLGFRSSLITVLIIFEAGLLGVVGGGLGAVGAFAFVVSGRFSLAVEGLNIELVITPSAVWLGLAIATTLGVVAGLVPALQASRRTIASSFRAV